MALIFINQETCAVVKLGQPTLRISTKGGLISFSQSAVEKAGLNPEKKIEFVFDDTENQLYFFESINGKGYELRREKDSKALSLNNTSAARKIQDFYQLKSVSFALLVGLPNKELIPDYTLYPLIKNWKEN